MIDFNEGKLNSTIEKSFKIGVRYLSLVKKRFYNFLETNNHSIEDSALDAITSLFIKDGTGNLPIRKAYDNWKPPIKTEEEFNFFLHKIVANRIEQHISKLLRESDPLFNSILNSVNYLIKKNGYRKTKYFGVIYIVETGTAKISNKVISPDVFYLIPALYFYNDKNLLRNLFSYLKEETNFFPAIPLNALILKYKKLKSSGFYYPDKIDSCAKTFELNESLKKGLAAAKNKLDNSYVKKKKLTEEESQKIFNALKDICEDLVNGGVNPGLYEYLKPYYCEISMEDYKVKYHNIIEYLFKVMKSKIAEKLGQ
jgi:hypothetical protein